MQVVSALTTQRNDKQDRRQMWISSLDLGIELFVVTTAEVNASLSTFDFSGCHISGEQVEARRKVEEKRGVSNRQLETVFSIILYYLVLLYLLRTFQPRINLFLMANLENSKNFIFIKNSYSPQYSIKSLILKLTSSPINSV
jgi:hypothetical protein